MSFSGAMIQNAIYIAQQPPEWPVAADDWERAAEEKLDPGAFGYIAGGAGAESTVRANLDAFAAMADPPADAHRQRDARHLGRGARPALAGAVPARAGRRALDRARGGRGRRRQRSRVVRRAARALERGDPLDRGGRRDQCAALVPALLGERPRDLRELRQPRRGRRVRRDRRHARHAHARLAAARPAPGVPAVHQGRRLRPVLQRPGLPLAARQDPGGGSPHGRRDDARDVPEHRARRGTTSTGCARRPRCRSSSRACSPPTMRGSRSSTASTGSSCRTTAAARSTGRSPRSTRSSRSATRCPRRSC